MATENVKTESNTKTDASTSQVPRAFELNIQKENVTKKKTIELLGRTAKAKLEKITGKTFKYNVISGKIVKLGDEFNDQLVSTRKEVIKNVTQKADAEARMEAKIKNATQLGSGNNNLIALRIKELMNRATDPDTVNPILENHGLELINFRNEVNGRAEQKEDTKFKPLNVIELLKDQLSVIGKNYKNYQRKDAELEETEKKEMTQEDILAATKKQLNRAGWKKAFKGVAKIAKKDEHDQLSDIKREIIAQIPVETNSIITIDELRRRKLLGEAGEGIEQINRLEKSLGENEKISESLTSRRNKLLKIVKDLGKVDIAEKESVYEVPEKTELQEVIDEVMNVKEPLTKEEHDAEERRLNEFFNDPFNIKQLERQQLEEKLYYYNNPEVSLKISEAERIADKQLSEKIRESVKQFDDDTLVKNVLESKVETNKDGDMIVTLKKDADILAKSIYEKNLVAQAVEEVTDNYKKKAAEELETTKMIKSDARRYAEDIYQKNLVSQAVEEVTNNYKASKLNEELQRNARITAENVFERNLAVDAVEEITQGYKKQLEKEKANKLSKEAIKTMADKTAKNLKDRNDAIDNARKDVEDHKDEIISAYEHQFKAFKIIKNAKNLIATRKLKNAADAEAKRIVAEQQRENIIDGAKETAKKLFVNNIKYDANELAKKLHMANLKEDGNKQAQLLFIEELKEEARKEAERIHSKRKENNVSSAPVIKQETTTNPFIVTNNVDNRVRETSVAKKVKLGENRFADLVNNSKKTVAKEDTKDMLVSLRDQLTELGLNDDQIEPETMKLAA